MCLFTNIRVYKSDYKNTVKQLWEFWKETDTGLLPADSAERHISKKKMTLCYFISLDPGGQ